MKKGLLAYLTPVFALILAGIVGYYSVYGLSKLFAGAATAVIILGATLESVKILGTALLHTYWKKFNWWVKTYMVIGVFMLMGITSMGVYGLLTSAYKSTSDDLAGIETKVELIEQKKLNLQSSIDSKNDQVEYKTDRMTQLVELRTQQEIRLDSLVANHHWQNANLTREEIKKANDQIEILEAEIDTLYMDITVLKDSMAGFDLDIIEIRSSSSATSELGPLMYLSELTGKPMDKIINWFMLLIIFVADPFAIILVIATTKIWGRKEEDDPPLETATLPGDNGPIPPDYESPVPTKQADFSFPAPLVTEEQDDEEEEDTVFNELYSDLESDVDNTLIEEIDEKIIKEEAEIDKDREDSEESLKFDKSVQDAVDYQEKKRVENSASDEATHPMAKANEKKVATDDDIEELLKSDQLKGRDSSHSPPKT